MIKGKKLTATDKYLIQNFSEDYLSLIGLIDKMEIKLEIVKSKIKLISINNYSINSFEELLHTKFDETISSIKSGVNSQESKASKIGEIDKYIIDYRLRYPFFSSKDLLLHHKQVSFVGKSKSNPETVADIQECYQTIIFFTQRLNQFLEELHQTILLSDDNTSFLSDTPALVSYSATSDNPFAFYEFIFKSHGILDLINQFAPSEDDILTHGIEYDKLILTKTYFERDDSGEWIRHDITFLNSLKQILSREFRTTKQCLEQKIGSIGDLSAISTYFLIHINFLIRMHDTEIKGIDDRYQKLCKKSIHKIISHIESNYNIYLKPRTNSLIQSFHQKLHNESISTDFPSSESDYHFYLCKISKEELVLKSWEMYFKKYIDKNDFKYFDNIFEGKIKQSKLKRISWKQKDGIKQKIKPLYYFFDKLRQAGVLDETEKTLKKKIKIMFADNEGKELKGIHQTFGQYKGKPGDHPDIDKLLDLIVNN